ncbi:MAG: DUF4164 domain-containing protein [Rhizobiaceae bacterium]
MVPSSEIPNGNSDKPGVETDQNDAVDYAFSRLDKALAGLISAYSSRMERDSLLVDAEAEVQRMGVDRSRLAESLDDAEARAKRLESTNKEVSRRLVDAMESIRTVLDREE